MVSSRWKKLAIKENTVNVEGEDITIKGLTYKELGELGGYEDAKDRQGALNYMLRVTLQKAPEVEEEEVEWLVENISAEHALSILTLVQNLSGLSEKKTVKND